MIIANNLGFVNQLETRAYNTKDITPNKKLNDSGQEALRSIRYLYSGLASLRLKKITMTHNSIK